MSCEFPIIWRSPESEFNNDEPLNASKIYTREVLKEIKLNGFNAIWMRGKLWEFGRSTAFPELNDAHASKRIDSLNKVIEDAGKIGLKVFLYFNEPLSLPNDHKFWDAHPEMQGEPHSDFDSDNVSFAFCTSSPHFMELFNEAVSNLYTDFPGLGGVILITTSEFHTHCWSHRSKRLVGDKYMDVGLREMECPRCREREPAEIVSELVNVWKKHADALPTPLEVWAWNWSWSMWYEQPQAEVISRLPDGVKLMCDFERGSMRNQAIGDVFIDEYSLGFVGPSARFAESRNVAVKRGMEVCSKLQIGTTHELATVPNIPLIGNLFDKLLKIDELDLKGLMCSWNFGNTLTANTAIFGFFFSLTSEEKKNRNSSLARFAETYFGLSAEKSEDVIKAWDKFAAAFGEYPFSIPMLYHSPINYAPAFPLSFHFEGREMGPSWIEHEPWGEDMTNCLSPFSIEQVVECYSQMSFLWSAGLEAFESALTESADANGADAKNTVSRSFHAQE
jgi:hypothetical protein